MSCLAVIDIETTGLNPYGYDRIVELAVVVMRFDGGIVREFVTLLNPERDIGPTSIHGITASDVISAPRFVEIAGEILDAMDGSVALGGHNIQFDRLFLSAEFSRLGHHLPPFPTLCSMQLAGGGTLSSCCSAYGIPFTGDKHVAIHDAQATARLLGRLLRDVPKIHARFARLPPIKWPQIPNNGTTRPLTRDTIRGRALEPPTYIQDLFSRSEKKRPSKSDDPIMLSYIALLDRVLEDRHVDESEAQSLSDIARRWGIAGDQIRRTHHKYLWELVRVALEDHGITDAERRDLNKVAHLLGLDHSDVDKLLESAPPRVAHELEDNTTIVPSIIGGELTGKRVCFTGESQCRYLGQRITREIATQLAMKHGMIVVDSVNKQLNVLVVPDPLTQSGKAKKARRYGIRILHEIVFWKILGIDVE